MTKLTQPPGTDQEVRLRVIIARNAAIFRARAQALDDIRARVAPRHWVDQRPPKPTAHYLEDDCRFVIHGVSP